ncbi:hypothetical protein [Prevotella sp. 10(H)]|uniref:hypothetical protein n=1 Tax=Prevotella sp. 10(H) TaxID=1158294 RepID=UPI0018CC1A73|nr:hypothetical protein [Prevotella sp. 10(H)]
MMKKIILLLAIVLTSSYGKADDRTDYQLQDSVRIIKKKLEIGQKGERIYYSDIQSIDGDLLSFDSLNSLNSLQSLQDLNLSSLDLLNDLDLSSPESFESLEEVKNLAELRNYTELEIVTNNNQKKKFVFNTRSSSGKNDKSSDKPAKTDKKTFSNISAIDVTHKYGNIVTRESSSKQVEVEIQYFEKDGSIGECQISNTGGQLSILTVKTGGKRSNAKINYIISIPRGTAFDVNINYGDVKMIDNFNGALNANLSYSNLSAQKISNATIKARYSDVEIAEAQDMNLSGAYSDYTITKVRNVISSGDYNDCQFDEINTLTIDEKSTYGDLEIGTINSFSGKIYYADLVIENLLSDINVTSNYGDITIKSVSSKVKNIYIKGSYCDVEIGLPSGLSATLDANIIYGDLNIPRSYTTKFTESSEKNNRVIMRGQIGKGNPTAKIEVSNRYADIQFR